MMIIIIIYFKSVDVFILGIAFIIHLQIAPSVLFCPSL
jgi:hypothetical protein